MRIAVVIGLSAALVGLAGATPVQALTKKPTGSCADTIKKCQSYCRGEPFCMAHCEARGCSGDWGFRPGILEANPGSMEPLGPSGTGRPAAPTAPPVRIQ